MKSRALWMSILALSFTGSLTAAPQEQVIQGSPIVLDLSPAGGGQLVVTNNTGDNKIFLEGFSSDGNGHASEMLITGRLARSLPLFTVFANTMRMIGKVQIGERIDAPFTLSPSNISPNAGFIRFGDNTGWKLHFGRSRESSGGPLNLGTRGTLMTIQDDGRVGIGTRSPLGQLHVVGSLVANSIVTGGCRGCDSPSDRNLKDNFSTVNPRLILDRLAEVPIQTWNYKSDPTTVRHIGAMAQDFRAAFNLGEDDKTLSAVDAQGVTMAAVQGLYQVSLEQRAQIEAQQEQLTRQRQEIDALRNLVCESAPQTELCKGGEGRTVTAFR